MKTRIKIVKYADGRTVYFAQTKISFSDTILEGFMDNPVVFIFFLPISILGSFIASKTTWKNMRKTDECLVSVGDMDFNEHDSIEEAKSTIDLFLLNEKADLEMKQAKKKSKKVVSKTYLKYP